MYFPDLTWHNILEFRYGKRPFGFWNWKSSSHNFLKEIEDKYYPNYYWASHQRHIYKPINYGTYDYTIYTVSAYGPTQSNWEHSVKPIKYIFKDKKYYEEFKKTLWWVNINHPT